MTETLREILRAEVLAQSSCSEAALMLSRGVDCFITGYACHEVGKHVTAYTYELDGIPSSERPAAEAVARHMGWPLRIVRVPTADARWAFLRLAIEFGCFKKTQFEVTYPIAHLIPAISQTEIFTGWNFDDHYGNTREDLLEMSRLRRAGCTDADLKAHFDASRDRKYARFDSAESPDTFWFASRIAQSVGKRLIDPSTATSVRRFFRQYTHDELGSIEKPLVRSAFADALGRLPPGLIAKGVKLQKGGGVHDLFRTLIDDPMINRFETKYATVSALCQRWAKEVRENPDQYSEELARVPRLRRASVLDARGADVHRPTMAERSVVAKAFQRHLAVCRRRRIFDGVPAGGRARPGDQRVHRGSRSHVSQELSPTFVDTRDIRDILRDPANVVALLALVGLVVGELNVLDGSPPCSEFSTAGNGPAEPNLLKAYSDRRQKDISSLPFEFARFTLIARPKVVVMENVPALASRGKAIFDSLIRLLSADYLVASRVLAASDYGVPQKRRRLFILGIRRDVAEAIGIRSELEVSRIFPNPTHTGVTVWDAFRDLKQSPRTFAPGYCRLERRRSDQQPQGCRRTRRASCVPTTLDFH